ncbi:MAG: Acetyltransferase [Chlamydiae bacterium]|nr:Acetyltransferase [Chlamydiota bacterium]
MPAPSIQTERLILRQWRADDLPAFAKLNADERVLHFFPSILTEEQSDLLAEIIQKELNEKDYGLWAVELKEGPSFIGFVGLHYQDFKADFTPCIEIGWRLAFEQWGKGYAAEAASEVIKYAFDKLKLQKLVSFTSASNIRSIKLMKRLGMTHNPLDDFEHPKLPEGHALRKHVLYKIRRYSCSNR